MQALSVRESLFFDSSKYRDRLLQLIGQAQKEILVTCYIVKSDGFGSEILNHLKKKAASGVCVKICVDGYGSSEWAEAIIKEPSVQNFEVRIYHPPPWWVPHIAQFVHLLYHFNTRNHQKLLLFDNQIAMIGSRNIHDEALEWRETSIEIEENDMLDLRNIFYNLWERSHTQTLKAPRRRFRAPKLPVPSPHYYSNHLRKLRHERNQAIRSQLLQAKDRILITTPYFMPRLKSLRLLCEKAKSGVRVELVLPLRTDVPISKWLAQSLYFELLECGVKIYEYKEKVLHAKTLIVDDWVLIGSSNFNRRSAIRDLEIDYSPRTESSIEFIIDRFEEDKRKSVQIHEVPKLAVPAFFAHLVSRVFYSWF